MLFLHDRMSNVIFTQDSITFPFESILSCSRVPWIRVPSLRGCNSMRLVSVVGHGHWAYHTEFNMGPSAADKKKYKKMIPYHPQLSTYMPQESLPTVCTGLTLTRQDDYLHESCVRKPSIVLGPTSPTCWHRHFQAKFRSDH